MSEPVQEQGMNSTAAGHEPVQWVSISEAARLLNISERGIHKRLTAGTMQRRRIEGRVEVSVSVSPIGDTDTGHELGHELPASVQEPEETSSGTGHEQGMNRALVEALQADVLFLRSELTAQREAHDQADGEFRRLLLSRDLEIARLQERVQLLIAPPVESQAAPEKQANGEQAGMEAQNTPQDAQEAGGGGNLPSEAQAGVQRAQETPRPRRWWQVWKRKD